MQQRQLEPSPEPGSISWVLLVFIQTSFGETEPKHSRCQEGGKCHLGMVQCRNQGCCSLPACNTEKSLAEVNTLKTIFEEELTLQNSTWLRRRHFPLRYCSLALRSLGRDNRDWSATSSTGPKYTEHQIKVSFFQSGLPSLPLHAGICSTPVRPGGLMPPHPPHPSQGTRAAPGRCVLGALSTACGAVGEPFADCCPPGQSQGPEPSSPVLPAITASC